MGKIGVLWFQVILGLFCFSFFFSSFVMYGNEFETKKKIQPKDKRRTTMETSFRCYSVEFSPGSFG